MDKNLSDATKLSDLLSQNPEIDYQQKTIFDPDVVERYSKMVSSAPGRILAVFEKNNKTERSVRELMVKSARRRGLHTLFSCCKIQL